MWGERGFTSALATMAVAAACTGAAADGSNSYVGIYGGAFFPDAPKVASHGFGGGPQFLDIDVGGFAGVVLGTPLEPNTLLFHHFEIYAEGQITEQDELSTPGIATIASHDGLVGAIFAPGDRIEAELDRERYEFGMRYRLDPGAHKPLPVSIVVTPFGGFGNENVQTTVSTGEFKTSDLDWWFVGAMFGAEHTINLGGPFSVALSGNAGGYYFDADGKYRDAFIGSGGFDASDDGFGFRGQGKVELRTMVFEGVQVSIFGVADYWSSVPYSNLSSVAFVATQLDTDDVLDLKVGAQLTISMP